MCPWASAHTVCVQPNFYVCAAGPHTTAQVRGECCDRTSPLGGTAHVSTVIHSWIYFEICIGHGCAWDWTERRKRFTLWPLSPEQLRTLNCSLLSTSWNIKFFYLLLYIWRNSCLYWSCSTLVIETGSGKIAVTDIMLIFASAPIALSLTTIARSLPLFDLFLKRKRKWNCLNTTNQYCFQV